LGAEWVIEVIILPRPADVLPQVQLLAEAIGYTKADIGLFPFYFPYNCLIVCLLGQNNS